MRLAITAARYVPRYRVEIKFNDGIRRVVDFGPFLASATNPMFAKYRHLKKFKTFRIWDGDLMWGDFEMIFPIADLYQGDIYHATVPTQCNRVPAQAARLTGAK
jgi:hypothetical protein